jgi:raffinose/stachyose/melibiose transport system permease protein
MSDAVLKGALDEIGEEPAATHQQTIRSRISPGRLLAYLLVFLLVIIYLGPMLVLINTALKTPQEFVLDPAAISRGLHLENFQQAWERAKFPIYIGNTILYTIVSTLLYILSAIFISFPIARGYVKGSRLIYLLYVIALFLPNSLIPQFQLMLRLHLYNTQAGYILLTLTGGLGPLILVGYIRSIPKELDEAAAMDGCGYFRYVMQIVIPLIKPALVTVMLLHAIGIWNDLIGPMIYLTDKKFYPVTRGLMVFYGQFGNEWTQLAAATLIMVTPMVILFIIMQRYIIEGAMRGSLKA